MIFSPIRQWIGIVKDIKRSLKNAKIHKEIAKASSDDKNVRNIISVKIPAGEKLYFINTNILEKDNIKNEKRSQYFEKAYKKWEEDDENKLKVYYLEGKSIKELSQIFQRRPGAIRSRLRKLGLIDRW